MSEQGKIKVIKKADKPPDLSPNDKFIEGHELSLLHLLAHKHETVTLKIAEKIALKRPREA